MSQERHRLRLKLPNGAELEAEGSEPFVRAERQEFLAQIQAQTPANGQTKPAGVPAAPDIAWESILELRGRNIQLRSKLRGDKTEKDACLVLLAAANKVLHQPKPTSTQLAKWLRSSGYPVLRMDRALQDAVSQGEILSSGSRRARRYELTAPGSLKALLLAEQLTAIIGGRPH